MVQAVGRNFHCFIENPRSFLNSKTIAVSGIIAFLAASKLIQLVKERGKPSIKAVIYQECRGLETYQEVNTILSKATPRVSRLWGRVYITVPGYQGRCYLEELATRVVIWNRNYYSCSTRQDVESPVGQEIVQKFYDLHLKAEQEMDDLKFTKSLLYFMYFVHQSFRDYSLNLENLTKDGNEPNSDLFQNKAGEK